MVDSLITFLQACKDYKLDARTNEHDDVVVCMGNEAVRLNSSAALTSSLGLKGPWAPASSLFFNI